MKFIKPSASIQEPRSAHLGQFHLRFSVDCIQSKQMQQISMTSSGRSHAFTSSNESYNEFPKVASPHFW